MATTFFGQGFEKGFRETLFRMTTKRFGVHLGLDAWIDSLDFQKLDAIEDAIFDPAATLEGLGFVPPQLLARKMENELLLARSRGKGSKPKTRNHKRASTGKKPS